MKWWGWIGIWFMVWAFLGAYIGGLANKYVFEEKERTLTFQTAGIISFFIVLIISAVVHGILK